MKEFPITLPEFKLFFMRDAGVEYQPYPDWMPETIYNKGDKVLYILNYKPTIWESQVDNNETEPSSGNNWTRLEDEEDWIDDWVLDRDIVRAMGEASFKFNPSLFNEEKGKMIFLYLTMFFLVYDKRMAAAGLSSSTSTAGPVIHRTVGKMTVTYAESKLFKNYPSYEFLSSNDYGRKAFNLMLPYLRAGIRIFRGGNTGF